jgi:hypothetical protein
MIGNRQGKTEISIDLLEWRKSDSLPCFCSTHPVDAFLATYNVPVFPGALCPESSSQIPIPRFHGHRDAGPGPLPLLAA